MADKMIVALFRLRRTEEKWRRRKIYNKQQAGPDQIQSDPDDRYNRPPQDRDPETPGRDEN